MPSGVETAKAEFIGRYQILGKLGEGGMASVYLAMAQGIGGFEKLVVVKTLRQDFVVDDEFRKMFLDEARLSARLTHPNIVHTYEVGEENGTPHLAMEFLDGLTLSVVVAKVGRASFPLRLAIRVVRDVLAALQYVHELSDFDGRPLSVVHRDVSPHNVVLTWRGVTKLMDFGIASVVGRLAETKTGVFKGKLGYASPEQVLATKVDHRADLFAVGVTLWELIAHKRYAIGVDEFELARTRTEGRGPELALEKPDTSPELLAIVAKALATSPDDRYASAKEFGTALEQWAEKNGQNATEKELSEFLEQSLPTQRTDAKKKLEDRIRAVRERRITSIEPFAPTSETSRASVADETDLTGADTSIGDSVKKARPTPPRKVNRSVLLAAGVGLIGCVGIFFARSPSPSGTARPQSSDIAPPPLASASVVSVPSAIPESSAKPASVHFTVRVEPPDGRIELDGKALGTGSFEGDLPRSTIARSLMITSKGFQPVSQPVVLRENTTLVFTLVALARHDGRASIKSNPLPSSQPTATTMTTSTPSSQPVHKIEEKDPYR